MDFKQLPRRPKTITRFGSTPQSDSEKPLQDDSINQNITDDQTTATTSSPLPNNPDQKEDMTPPKRRSKKKKLVILIILVVLLIASVAGAYWFFFKPKAQTVSTTTTEVVKKEAPKPKPTSPLTGVIVASEDITKRPVTGIMIENSPDARPQSGLTDAGVVYEAIAEGGITRFLAIYQEAQPSYIGPVRSARPYYLDLILGFDGSYAHVGGSPDAIANIKTLGVKDLDQFYNSQAYVRISSRYAPHNVYTGFDKLDALNASKGYTTSKFTPFVRKPDVPQTASARVIDFSISGPLYSPRFEYDAASNTYKRFQGGEAHIDQQSKVQIAPKTVIALITEKGYDPDGYHTAYKMTGSGKIYVFQDGIVSEGTWQKADQKSQYVFTDKNGLPMKLNAGQTWLSLIANQTDVTFKP